ncbi:MAG: RsmE family RNA methyltransferase [Phycisphaerales bacterium JB038]
MADHRIYIGDQDASQAEKLRITGPEAAHAIRVRRLGPGAPVTLFDGRGRVLSGEILEAGKRALTVQVRRATSSDPPQPAVHLRAATAKGERTDRMLEALSQLGAASFAPLRTDHSVVHPRDAKLERWRRLAIESAKQCRRAHLMRIEPLLDLHAALAATSNANERLLLDASGEPYAPTRRVDEIELFVGPEGGWSEAELDACRAAGARLVALPTHILRIETAAAAGLAIVLQEQHRLRQREDA